MRLIFMGTPDFAVPALLALVRHHEIAAVYCQPPRPAGRGHRPRPCAVQIAAEAQGLPVRHPASLRGADEQQAFAALQADVAVVAAYGLILPRAVLEAPRRGCLNIHASLLPRWRGAAPIHRAIMAGDTETGICIMRMESGLDTGPVLLRRAIPIGPDDTTGDLHERLGDLGAQLAARALEDLDRLTPEPQPEAGVTYAHKIDKAEARIAWSRPAAEVDRHIRGLSPFPGAWCMANGARLKILRSRLVPGSGPAGTLLATDGDRLLVACGSGAVEIREAQREGRRPMPANELLRGLALHPGDRLD